MSPTSSSLPLTTAEPSPGGVSGHAGLLSGRWSVRLLGRLEASNGDVRLSHFVSQPIAALLARLALLPQRAHPREELIELLWPGVDLAVGRNRLRNAISSLRRLLEPPGVAAGSVLLADRQSVQFAPQASHCDAIEFEAAVRAGDAPPGPRAVPGRAAARSLRRLGAGASPAPRGAVRAGGRCGRCGRCDAHRRPGPGARRRLRRACESCRRCCPWRPSPQPDLAGIAPRASQLAHHLLRPRHRARAIAGAGGAAPPRDAGRPGRLRQNPAGGRGGTRGRGLRLRRLRRARRLH